MRTIVRFFVLLAFVGICDSSKADESIYGTRIEKAGLTYNKVWHKTMKDREKQAKEYWKKHFANFIVTERKLSDIELENTKTIIVENYRIYSSVLDKWDTLSPVQRIMSLCIDTASLYVFPKDQNPWRLPLKFVENQWKTMGYYPLQVTLNQIYDLHFKKDLPFINVDFVEKSGYQWHFFVYIDENGELMSMRFGVITPLKEVLKGLLKEYVFLK